MSFHNKYNKYYIKLKQFGGVDSSLNIEDIKQIAIALRLDPSGLTKKELINLIDATIESRTDKHNSINRELPHGRPIPVGPPHVPADVSFMLQYSYHQTGDDFNPEEQIKVTGTETVGSLLRRIREKDRISESVITNIRNTILNEDGTRSYPTYYTTVTQLGFSPERRQTLLVNLRLKDDGGGGGGGGGGGDAPAAPLRSGKWNCPTCTFKNKGENINCEICGVSRPDEWICSTCSFKNKGKNINCEICGVSRAGGGGGGHLPSYSILMRHGERADNKDAWFSPGRKWRDDVRPYDPPLSNFKCVLETAAKYNERFAPITCIVSSPFKRCLETATGIAVHLKRPVDTIYVNPNVGEQGDAIKDETSAYRPLSLDAMQIVVNEVAKFFGRPAPRVIMRPIGDISFDNELEKANHARSIVRLFRTINAEISAFPTKERDSLLIVSHGGSIDAMWKAPKSAKVSDIKQGRIATPEYCGYILINSKNEITPGNGVELLDIPGM